MKELAVAEHDPAKGLGLQETRDIFGTFLSRTGNASKKRRTGFAAPFPGARCRTDEFSNDRVSSVSRPSKYERFDAPAASPGAISSSGLAPPVNLVGGANHTVSDAERDLGSVPARLADPPVTARRVVKPCLRHIFAVGLADHEHHDWALDGRQRPQFWI